MFLSLVGVIKRAICILVLPNDIGHQNKAAPCKSGVARADPSHFTLHCPLWTLWYFVCIVCLIVLGLADSVIVSMKGCQLTAICSLMNDDSSARVIIQLAYLWGAADVIFTQQLVTCQCWSRPLQLVLLIQNFSDRSAQESSHVVLWCLWQIQTWMNGYFCLHLWRQRSLVLYLKERHYPSLMHWDYVANLMSDASHYWHWYPLCKLFVNSVVMLYCLLLRKQGILHGIFLMMMILFFAPSVVVYCHQVSVMFYCCLCRPYTMKTSVKFKKDVLKTWRMSDCLSCLKTDGQRVTELLI